MRRLFVALALMSLVLATTGGAASAAPRAGCPVGPKETGTASIGAFELLDLQEFVAIHEAAGFDAASTTDVFEGVDKNDDGLACVMTQVLPNDASGSDTWFVSMDNVARAR